MADTTHVLLSSEADLLIKTLDASSLDDVGDKRYRLKFLKNNILFIVLVFQKQSVFFSLRKFNTQIFNLKSVNGKTVMFSAHFPRELCVCKK